MTADRVTDFGNQNPALCVEVTRGDLIESRHWGAAAVMDARGSLVASWGDVARPVYPRSAVKALQFLACVESGAADAAGFGAQEMALACASHNGEAVHVETAGRMLVALGLGVMDMECGSHWPMDKKTVGDMNRAGQTPDALHNNCSGKHAAMLALARQIGAPTAGYTQPDHPVQERIRACIGELCDTDLAAAPLGIDGCSVPTWALALQNLALGFARFTDGHGLGGERATAAARIRTAVLEHPYMVAGRGRFCTRLMQACGRRVFVKTGAEGVFCAALPERGLGVALKCDDGATRGAEMMLATVLDHLGALDRMDADLRAEFLNLPLTNRRKITVGHVRPAPPGMA